MMHFENNCSGMVCQILLSRRATELTSCSHISLWYRVCIMEGGWHPHLHSPRHHNRGIWNYTCHKAWPPLIGPYYMKHDMSAV